MPVELDTRAAYDAWATTYDTDANKTVAAAPEVLASLVPQVDDLDVVELGCGTGANLRQLRGARSLTGLDLSEGMLAQARLAAPEASLHVADLTAPLPLPDTCADLVLISLVLEHIADPAAVLVEAARLLRDQGRLLLLELHPDRRAAGSRAQFERDGVQLRPPSFLHTRASLVAHLGAAGLSVEHVHDGPRLLARVARA
jgi:malonyl-CoA O-methyltransferase